MDISVTLEASPAIKRQILETLTARLPQWFGQAEPNRHYARQAESLEGWVARVGGEPAGLLLLKEHGPARAEIYWLGVDPDFHRHGVGRTLVQTVERRLEETGVRFLFLMTLHPDVEYEPYRRTRTFYESLGFAFALSTNRGPVGPSADPLAYYVKAL